MLFSILFAVHASIASFFTTDRNDCKCCKEAPYGYSLDATGCTGCDDCIRRTLVYERMSYEAIWDYLSLGEPGSMELVEFLCTRFDLYIGQDLSQHLRKAGASSQFLFPSPNVTDPSFTSFYKHVVKRQVSVERMAASRLWSNVLPSGKKAKKAARKAEEEKVVDAFSANPEWVIPKENLGDKLVDGYPPEAIVSLMLKRGVFLDKDRFLSIIPAFCAGDFHGLREVSPQLFDHIEERVDRWVRVGSEDTGLPIAKGVCSIIDHQIDTELAISGDTVLLSKYKHLAEIAKDTSCGFTRTTHLNFHLLKSEFLKDHGTYYNLVYSTAIHCQGLITSCEKVYERRFCQIHGIGYPDDYEDDDRHHVMRQPWIPGNFGLRTPGGVVSAMKPILCGVTAAALQTGCLAASLMNYFTSKAVLIAASFTTLHPSVQSFLVSKFKKASSVPTTLIARLVGVDINAAAELIFSKTPDPVSVPTQKKDGPKPEKAKAVKSPKLTNSVPDSQGTHPYQGFTDPQCARLSKAFGGDFKAYLKVKAKQKLKGNLDLLKLANYFKDGKPSFGKLSVAQVTEKCLN